METAIVSGIKHAAIACPPAGAPMSLSAPEQP